MAISDKKTGPAQGTSANYRQVGGDHYKSEIQHWDYVLANKIPYLEAQVIKYLTRWRSKNGLEDLRKARHFLDKLIEHEFGSLETDENARYRSLKPER